MTKKKLYILVWALAFIGYSWLCYNSTETANQKSSFCVTKNITGYPCPACGSTRSALSILEGNLYHAVLLNPLGYLVLALLIILPLWVFVDLILSKNSFYQFYTKTEKKLRNNYFLLFGGIVLLLNWIWNINKGL
jgi:hypothetical protein